MAEVLAHLNQGDNHKLPGHLVLLHAPSDIGEDSAERIDGGLQALRDRRQPHRHGEMEEAHDQRPRRDRQASDGDEPGAG